MKLTKCTVGENLVRKLNGGEVQSTVYPRDLEAAIGFDAYKKLPSLHKAYLKSNKNEWFTVADAYDLPRNGIRKNDVLKADAELAAVLDKIAGEAA
jgi:hypothetical protein